MICTAHELYSGNQVKKNEMDRSCGTYGRQERFIDGFGGKKDHLEGLGVDERVILKWIFRNCKEGHGLIWLRIGTVGGLL
jgi:hypothetical protein